MMLALDYFKSIIGKDASESPSPLTRWLNPTVVSAEEGELVLSYIVRDEMLNPLGALHGGTTAALVDDAIGAAVFSLGNSHAYMTVNLAVDYFAGAKLGDKIFAKASIVKKGNQIMNAQCEVWNEDYSKMIAKGHSNLIKSAIKLG